MRAREAVLGNRRESELGLRFCNFMGKVSNQNFVAGSI